MLRAFLWSSLAIVSVSMLAAKESPAMSGKGSQLLANLKSGRKQTVVAYGTSLTAAGAWVNQLASHLEKQHPGQVNMINSGGSGKYSKWGVQNLEKRVIQKKPDTVLIEFCINDSVGRFNCSVDQARKNLEAMIERILKSNPSCEIILMTMTPAGKYPKGHRSHRVNIAAYYDMYRQVAKARSLLLIDHYPNWIALRQKDKALFAKYVPDTIHPTPDGCAKVVTPVILKALGFSK